MVANPETSHDGVESFRHTLKRILTQIRATGYASYDTNKKDVFTRLKGARLFPQFLLQRSSLKGLDLADIESSPKKPFHSKAGVLSHEEKEQYTPSHLLARHHTISTFFKDALYNNEYGYYSAGNVQFGNGEDFNTNSTDAPKLLAILILLNAFASWREEKKPSWVFCEEGAGNGFLTKALLDNAKLFSGINAEWKQFYECITCRIREISPELVKRQTDTLKDYIETEQVQIFNQSALEADEITIDFLFSNELLDAFPVCGFKITESGEVKLVLRIATLADETKLQMLPDYQSIQIESERDKVALQHIHAVASEEIPTRTLLPKSLLTPQFKYEICWHDICIGASNLPIFNKFLSEDAMQFAALPVNKIIYLNEGLGKYCQRTQTAKETLALDYGDSCASTSMRVYGKKCGMFHTHNFTKGRFSMDKWGQFDLTTDVNFSSLRRILLSSKQTPSVEYGIQAHLLSILLDRRSDAALEFLEKEGRLDGLMEEVNNFAGMGDGFKYAHVKRLNK